MNEITNYVKQELKYFNEQDKDIDDLLKKEQKNVNKGDFISFLNLRNKYKIHIHLEECGDYLNDHLEYSVFTLDDNMYLSEALFKEYDKIKVDQNNLSSFLAYQNEMFENILNSNDENYVYEFLEKFLFFFNQKTHHHSVTWILVDFDKKQKNVNEINDIINTFKRDNIKNDRKNFSKDEKKILRDIYNSINHTKGLIIDDYEVNTYNKFIEDDFETIISPEIYAK